MSKYQEALNDLRQFVEAFSCEYPDMAEEYGLNKTVKAFGELVDKETPKKLQNDYYCPYCTSRVKEYNLSNDRNDYCGQCGQALDWSDEQ